MTTNDLTKLAQIWRQKDVRQDTNERIRKILRNKRCDTVIKELKVLLPRLSGQKKNMAVLIVVLCLLHSKSDRFEEIKKALIKEGLIPNLYGGLCIFLGGKSSTMHLAIRWADAQFPNRYEYLSRFSGEFGYWENYDIVCATRLLEKADKAKFEELAWKDTTRLILLNMVSLQYEEFPSQELIARLLRDGDELQANVGFYFAVWGINRDLSEYRQLIEKAERRKMGLPNIGQPKVKPKKEIRESIVRHLGELDVLLKECSEERRASLIMNYILYEEEYPTQFGYWLMEKRLQKFVLAEIASDKIKNLKKLMRVASLIHDVPSRDENGVCLRKDNYYRAVLCVLERFLTNREGIYQWNATQEAEFREICEALPKKYRKQLYHLIQKEEESLMVSKLDEMVRFQIYLKDKAQAEICRGMREVMGEG